MSKYVSFKGAVTELITPFPAAGEVDYELLRGDVEYQIKAGIAALFTNGLAKALYKLGKVTRQQANLFFIPLDTLCSFFIFWLVDVFMDSVTATSLSILVLALIFALLSQPIGKGDRPDGGEEAA